PTDCIPLTTRTGELRKRVEDPRLQMIEENDFASIDEGDEEEFFDMDQQFYKIPGDKRRNVRGLD
ncbi:MAG: hypothetical protein AAF480_13080, partial [Actinomycetota bacterium]